MYPRCELIFDVTSPAGVKIIPGLLKKTGIEFPMQIMWGLKNVQTVLSWNPRIKYLGQYKLFKAPINASNIKVRIQAWLYDLFNIQYLLHLKIGLDYNRIPNRSDNRDTKHNQ